MEKEELQKIIDRITETNSKDDAYFGIFRYGGGPDESFIRANKQGLELFAVDLLKASRDTEEIISDPSQNAYTLEFEEEWIDEDSETLLQYVEPSIDKRESAKPLPYKENWKDKLIGIGCFTGIIFLAVSVIVGIVSIFRWIYY